MTSQEKLVRELEEALGDQPLLDAHTHLDASHLAARGLHDILLYHMVVSDMASAGYRKTGRVPDSADIELSHAQIERAMPFVPAIENTSCYWLVRVILKDLYGWAEPVRPDNWRKLDSMIRDRSSEADWPREIVDRSRIRRSCSELWRRRDGQADWLLQYSLESAFFARCQWGEYDTPLVELERAWGLDSLSGPSPISPAGKSVSSVRDVDDALDHYVATMPCETIISTAQHVSTDIDYAEATAAEMAEALARRDRAGRDERNVYASYILEGFLSRLEARTDRVVFQFSLGAEPMPVETDCRVSQSTLAQLGRIVARHPGLQFQCFLAAMHANQSLCTMARELPNLTLAGYWWHNFFPGYIARVMHEAAGHAGRRATDRVLLRRVLPGVELRKGCAGSQDSRSRAGREDPDRPVRQGLGPSHRRTSALRQSTEGPQDDPNVRQS